MKNVTMKNIITAGTVILVSVIIMLISQLIHLGFQFAAVDWQSVILKSFMIDAIVFSEFACIEAGKSKLKGIR